MYLKCGMHFSFDLNIDKMMYGISVWNIWSYLEICHPFNSYGTRDISLDPLSTIWSESRKTTSVLLV